MNMRYVIPIIIALVVSVIIFSIGNQFPKQSFTATESHQETIQNVREITTSFNDRQRMQVETDAGFYFINSIVSVKRNEKVTIKTGVDGFDNPKIRLCIKDKCYKVIQ